MHLIAHELLVFLAVPVARAVVGCLGGAWHFMVLARLSKSAAAELVSSRLGVFVTAKPSDCNKAAHRDVDY